MKIITLPEKILLAAAALPESFSAADLVCAAWRDNLSAFGMDGYPHPDTNKVLAALMGKRGLVAQGLLARVAPKRYAITTNGRVAIRRLKGEDVAPELVPTVPAGLEKRLLGLLDSEAHTRYREGRKADVTFGMALGFWGLTYEATETDIDAALLLLASVFQEAVELAESALLLMSTGRAVDAAEVRVLGHCHRYLEDRFSRHLNLQRNRKEKVRA